MKKYVISYYKYHKYTSFLTLILTIIFTCVVLSINTIIEYVSSSNLSVLKDKYGEHQVVIHNVNNQELQNIKESALINEVGCYQNYGNYEVTDTSYHITLGFIDNTSLQLGHIDILEGRLPVSNNEICLEEHYKYYLFDSELSLGDVITLSIDDVFSYDFKICGFISDYSGCWINVEDLVVGSNDYPGGLITENNPFIQNSFSNHLLVTLHGTSLFNVVGENYYSLCELLDDPSRQIPNDEVYYQYYLQIIQPVILYKTIFLVLYFLVGIVLFYNLFMVFLSYFEKEIYIFKSLGLSKAKVSILYLFLTLIIYAIGALIGYIISLLFFAIFNNGIYFNDFINKSIYILIVFLVYIITHIFVHVKLNSKNNKRLEAKDFKDSYISSLAAINLKTKYVRIVGLFILISFTLSIFTGIDLDKKNRNVQYLTSDYNEIIAYANPYTKVAQAGPFEITSFNDAYNPGAVTKLNELIKDDVILFQYSFDSNNYFMIPNIEDPYWKVIENEWYENTYLVPSTIDFSKIDGLDEKSVGTQLYSTFTIKKSNEDQFKKLFPQIDVENDLALGKIILFLAPRHINEYEEYDDIVNPLVVENYLKEGDSIELKKLISTTTLEDAEIDASKVVCYTDKLFISKIFHENFYYEDDVQTIDFNSFPRIIWTEETAKSCKSINGVEQIIIKLPRDISDSEYNSIIQEIYRVGYSTKNSKIDESKFINDYLDRFYMMINISYSIMVLLIFISIGISMYSLIYTSLLTQKRTYGILRTLGIRKKALFKITFIEYFTYWITGFTTTPLIIYLITSVFVKKVLFMNISIRIIIPYFILSFLIYAVILIGILLFSYIYTNKVCNLYISESINTGE